MAEAQSKRNDDFHLWASATAGPSIQSASQRASGELSVWGTRGTIAASVRDAGVFRFMEPGEKHDFSVLIGRRVQTSRTIIVGGFGAGIASGHRGYLAPEIPNEPVIAVGGQALASLPWAGIGVSAFGAFGSTMSYGGIGLTLAIGSIR